MEINTSMVITSLSLPLAVSVSVMSMNSTPQLSCSGDSGDRGEGAPVAEPPVDPR